MHDDGVCSPDPEWLAGDTKDHSLATNDSASSSTLLGEENKCLLFFSQKQAIRKAEGRYIPTREFGEGKQNFGCFLLSYLMYPSGFQLGLVESREQRS